MGSPKRDYVRNRSIYRNGTRYGGIPGSGKEEKIPPRDSDDIGANAKINTNTQGHDILDREPISVRHYHYRDMPSGEITATKIAVGIALGIGIVWLVSVLSQVAIFSTTAAVVDNEIEKQKQAERANAEAMRAQAEASMAYRAREERLLVEAKERERIQSAEKEEANRKKEESWKAFYQENPLCKYPPTWRQTVECSNEKVRQYREFEKSYTP